MQQLKNQKSNKWNQWMLKIIKKIDLILNVTYILNYRDHNEGYHDVDHWLTKNIMTLICNA